jgi:predicted PurR-regulated permease PerM
MFAKHRPTPTNVTAAAVVTRSPAALWTDVLGRAATRCAQVILILVVVVFVVYAAVFLKLAVIPVLIALILSSALRPVVRLLEKHMPRIFATILSLLAAIIVIGGIIFIAVLQVEAQFSALQKSVTKGVDQVIDFVNNGPINITDKQIDDARQSLMDFVTSSQFGTGALAGVSTAVEIGTGVVLTVVVLFYFSKDGPEIWAFLIKPFKPEMHAKARRAGDSAVASLGGYVRGTATVAFVDAFFIGVAMVILHVPLAIPLAIVVFMGAFIPLVGATATGIIAALVTLVTVDLNAAIWVTAVVLAVQFLEGNFLSPVVLGKSLRLHGLVVLLALTAGTILGGIIGTLISVPAAAVAWAVIKQWNDPIVPDPQLDFGKKKDEEFEKQRTKRERKLPA